MEETLSRLERLDKRSAGPWSALGFSKWKRRFIPYFLGGEPVQFVDSADGLACTGSWLVWSSKVTPDIELRAKEQNVPLWRMEDGFIRSAGLGIDLVPPLSLVMDSRGIYYDATRSSSLELMLQHTSFDDQLRARAKALINLLVQTGVTKYNVGKRSTPLALPEHGKIVLVPGQVETDASIRFGALRWRTNLELLQQVREANPDAFIIYKPHPDVLAGGRAGKSYTHAAKKHYDLLVKGTGMSELLDQVHEVHTLTSLSGFEALLRGRKVVTYGMPFYAGWGLTTDKLECKRRTRKLTLEELVAAALILYPTYIDPDTGELITPEKAVEILSHQLGSVRGPTFKALIIRYIKKLSGRLE